MLTAAINDKSIQSKRAWGCVALSMKAAGAGATSWRKLLVPVATAGRATPTLHALDELERTG